MSPWARPRRLTRWRYVILFGVCWVTCACPRCSKTVCAILFLSPSQLLGTISVHLRSLCIRVDERARFVTERELQIFARNAPALTQLCIVGASSLASASIATAATNGAQPLLVLCDEAELAQRARAEEDDGWPCSDLAFMHIAKNCRELRALRVCGGKTGNQAMQHLSLYCPELEHLDLGYKSRCVFLFY